MTPPMATLTLSTPIVQSPVDQKAYRHITLPNQMQVLLIHVPTMQVDSADGIGDAASVRDDAETCSVHSAAAASEAMSTTTQGSHSEAGDATRPKRAAVAMAVGAGSFSDPPDMQGLSHFLEHMLFMGSKAFPGENEYDDFLVKHAGSSNAYTEAEYTNFHFDVEPGALRPALERFSAFFREPLFLDSALEREVNAVDSEFTGVQQDDQCRLIGAMTGMVRPSHPLRTFMWGNKKSLWDLPLEQGINIPERIMEHYRQQYSASRMRLVICSGQALGELQAWAEDLFAPVANDDKPLMSIKESGYPFEASGVCLAPAIREGHHLVLSFQLPPLLQQYGAKADEYVSHLVGHEGPGSLLSELKARNWATGVCAGVSDSGQHRNTAFSFFQAEIELTSDGLAAGPGFGMAVAELFFQYLSMLRRAGAQQWVWDECRRLSDMRFRFKQDHDAIDTVTQLASDMRVYAPHHVLVGGYLHDKWDPHLVEQLVSLMAPDREGMRVDVQTSDFDSLKGAFATTFEDVKEQHEPWFDMPFVSASIPQRMLSAWAAAEPDPALALPPPNPFVPSDFALLQSPPNTIPSECDLSEVAAPNGAARSNGAAPQENSGTQLPAGAVTGPACLVDEPGLRVLHKTVTAYETPHAVALFRLASDGLSRDPAARAAALLLVDTWNDVVTEVAYQADLAGLSSHIGLEGSSGIEIAVTGFSDKLPTLVQSLFQALAGLRATANWDGIKEHRVQSVRNGMLDVAKHAHWLRLRLLMTGNHEWRDTLAALEALTPESVERTRAALLERVHVEALVEGNVSPSAAVDMCRAARKTLGGEALLAGARSQERCVELPPSVRHHLSRKAQNEDEKNSASHVFVQLGPYSTHLRALQLLCHQVLDEPLFNVLRTKQQLGYSVGISPTSTADVLGFLISVTSDKHPREVEAAVEAFCADAVQLLRGLSSAQFEQHVDSLAALRLEPHKNIGEQAEEHWQAVWRARYDFYDRYLVVNELRKITQDELVEFYCANVAPGSKQRRQLTVHVCSHNHSGAEDKKTPGTSAAHHDKRMVEVQDIARTKQALHLIEPPTPGKLQVVDTT